MQGSLDRVRSSGSWERHGAEVSLLPIEEPVEVVHALRCSLDASLVFQTCPTGRRPCNTGGLLACAPWNFPRRGGCEDIKAASAQAAAPATGLQNKQRIMNGCLKQAVWFDS